MVGNGAAPGMVRVLEYRAERLGWLGVSIYRRGQ